MNSSRMRSTGWIIVLSLIGLGFAGCATPSQPARNYLSDMDYVGSKSVKYLVYPSPVTKASTDGGKKIALTRIKVQVCDVDDQNEETDCKMSSVLDSVTRGSLQQERQDSDDELVMSVGIFKDETTVRSLDSVYWYDDKTMFVAYRVSGGAADLGGTEILAEPKVKRCRLQSDNSLKCEDSSTLNSALFQQQNKEM